MRVFVAGLVHESSEFSPIPTSRRSFKLFEYHRPENGVPDDTARELNGYGTFIRLAEKDGHEVYASTYTFAQPSAPCSRSGYESLRNEILEDLLNNEPFDMVFMFLHGSQMADGYDDCEGDLLRRVRDIVGPSTFIGGELDLHTNMTDTMINSANVLIACKEYPHIDFDERAVELYEIGFKFAKGEIDPQMSFERLPLVGMYYTTEPAMQAANSAVRDLEKQTNILSASLIHGFPWANVPHLSAGMLVVRDGQKQSDEEQIKEAQKLFFAAREETRSIRKSCSDILDIIEAADDDHGPFVIADACDNAGGGAGSDSTFILQEILNRGLTGFVVGLFWDPIAVQFAEDVEVGGKLKIRLAGKTGPWAGAPIDVDAKVIAVKKEMTQQGLGYTHPIGTAAAFEIDGNIAVASTVRGQVFNPSCFTDLGIDLQAACGIVVKSSQHFFANFAPIASQVLYCDTPAMMTLDPDPSVFTEVARPMWPFDDVKV